MRAAALICALAISGCCTQHPSDIAPEPEKRISLQDAFESAAEGISKFRQTLSKNHVTLGMVVCKIEVSFNVSAEATAGNTAGLARISHTHYDSCTIASRSIALSN